MMKNLINNIFAYIKLVISHYKIKIKYISHDKFEDKVEGYSKMYNQVLSDINPAYLEEFNNAVDKNYLDIFEKYLDDKHLEDLLRYEVEIDYYKKFSNDIDYNRAYNGKFSYSKVRNDIDELFQNKFPDGVKEDMNWFDGKIIDESISSERKRVINKHLLYMKESDRYPFINQYVFHEFYEKISEVKLEIYNYLSIVNNDNIEELVEKLIRDLLDKEKTPYELFDSRMYSIKSLSETPSGLRFMDVNPKNLIKPTFMQKAKVFFDSLIYVKRDFKILKRFASPHFVGKVGKKSKLSWFTNLLVYIQYLFNGSLFRNYRKLKKYDDLLSDYKNVKGDRKRELRFKMMQSLELHDRLTKEGR